LLSSGALTAPCGGVDKRICVVLLVMEREMELRDKPRGPLTAWRAAQLWEALAGGKWLRHKVSVTLRPGETHEQVIAKIVRDEAPELAGADLILAEAGW